MTTIQNILQNDENFGFDKMVNAVGKISMTGSLKMTMNISKNVLQNNSTKFKPKWNQWRENSRKKRKRRTFIIKKERQ